MNKVTPIRRRFGQAALLCLVFTAANACGDDIDDSGGEGASGGGGAVGGGGGRSGATNGGKSGSTSSGGDHGAEGGVPGDLAGAGGRTAGGGGDEHSGAGGDLQASAGTGGTGPTAGTAGSGGLGGGAGLNGGAGLGGAGDGGSPPLAGSGGDAGSAGATQAGAGGETSEYAEHCVNSTRDADETGIDCGGSCNACPDRVCVRPGVYCFTDYQCPTGEQCVAQRCEPGTPLGAPCSGETCGYERTCWEGICHDYVALPQGEPCESDSFCVTGGCYRCAPGFECMPGNFGNECSTTAPIAEEGMSCVSVACAPGLYCPYDTTDPEGPSATQCQVKGALGTPCDPWVVAPCEDGLSCINLRCSMPSGPGGPCDTIASQPSCQAGLYCTGDDICHPQKPQGEACARSEECAIGLHCPSGTCVPAEPAPGVRQIGQSCTFASVCVAGALCNQQTACSAIGSCHLPLDVCVPISGFSCDDAMCERTRICVPSDL